jgi:hypothetical protein
LKGTNVLLSVVK